MEFSNGNQLHFKINEKQYSWHEQYITGAEIRKMGNIPMEDEIFLKIKEPWTDEPIILLVTNLVIRMVLPLTKS